MSKLIDAIKECQLNRRSTKIPPLDFAQFEEGYIQTRIGIDYTQYRFEARFGLTVDICDDFSGITKGDVLLEVKKSVQHSVANEIFGEFRQPLLKLRKMAYASGDLESAAIVNKILDDMFKI